MPKDFTTLLNTIPTRPNYKSHTVLDRGQEVLLVRTTTNLWFLYDKGTWKEIRNCKAKKLCKQYYFEYRFSEMI